MKRHDTPTASGRLPAALLLLLLALSGPPLRSYTVVTNPLAVTLDAMYGNDNVLYVTRTRPAGQGGTPVAFDALSVAVGWTFRLYISGGLDAEFSPDDEYCRGECGYGYWWPECLANAGVRTCGHALHYGLDADQCRQENSQYLWYSLDGGAAPPEPMPPAYYTTMVEDASGPYSPLPGGHSVTLGFHNAFCIHGRNDMGFGHCHEVIRPHHEAAQPVNVVRMGSIANQSANFSTCKVDSHEPGYVSGFSEEDWLSLPLGGPDSTAVFTAAPYPAAAWPPGTPSWQPPAAPAQSSVDPDDRARITVRTNTAFAGSLRAECGTSFISMGLNVVEVEGIETAVVARNGDPAAAWNAQGGYPSQNSGPLQYAGLADTADGKLLVVRAQDAWLSLLAVPNPRLGASVPAAEAKLPGAWEFTGGEAATPKMVRKLDLSVPGVTVFTARCGVSVKKLTVHVVELDILGDADHDGALTSADNGRAQNQDGTPGAELEETRPGQILALPSDDDTPQDAALRYAPIQLNTAGIAAVSALPQNQPVSPEDQTPRLWLDYDDTLLEISVAPGGGLLAPGQALPLADVQTVYVRGLRASNYMMEGEKRIVLHYASKLFGASDAVVVTVLDITPVMANGGYLLVNDDNDDMGTGNAPANVEKDMLQSGPLGWEDDDLQNASFPFRFPELGGIVPGCSVSLSIEGGGGLNIFSDKRKTSLILAGAGGVMLAPDTNITPLSYFDDGDAAVAMYFGDALQLSLEGTQRSGAVKGTRLVATWKINRQELRAVLPLTILEMRMAVDGGKNRGKNNQDDISFDDFGTINSLGDYGSYRCVFWPNTDQDVSHYENEPVPPLDFDWHEDDCPTDVDGSSIPANCSDEHIGRRGQTITTQMNADGTLSTVILNPSDSENHCLRDLEDFNRLHLKLDPVFTQMQNVEFHLSGAPVNIFEAVQDNLQYLTVQAIAERQEKKKRLLAVGESNQPPIPLESLKFDGDVSPFIWEGRNTCDTELTLTAKMPGNRIIGRKKVRIVLKDISEFFDKWDSADTVPNDGFARPAICDVLGQTVIDYILFVHGFNVNAYEKSAWPATAYKRLWWQGFKGRLGIFRWPCELFSPTASLYDNSDFKAWNSGDELEKLLEHLQRGAYGNHVHLLAHSQGNIVAGNALRMLPDNLSIKTYIASQAAISESCYRIVPRPYFEIDRTGERKTPDVRCRYPGWAGSTRMPFLDTVRSGMKADKLVNFFNNRDFALTSALLGSWEQNNRLRPDMGYGYHGNTSIYNGPPLDNQSFFYQEITSPPIELLQFPSPVTDHSISNVMDTYKIFSYAAQAWGRPVGCLNMSGIFQYNRDLEILLGYDNLHYSHSRQFRSSIIMEKTYWQLILSECANNSQNH